MAPLVHFVEILILSLALSADAFTVATTIGIRHRRGRQIFRLTFHFGLFQSLLALIGALAGTFFVSLMSDYDHWIAFALLVFIGLRMIHGALKNNPEKLANLDLTRGVPLIGLSLAVSMDALAAGVGLPAVGGSFWLAVVLIGVTAAAASLVAMLLAGRMPEHLGKRLEIAAGLVLIGLGFWTLFAHHAFGK
jgi:manganese efflux pump family protein